MGQMPTPSEVRDNPEKLERYIRRRMLPERLATAALFAGFFLFVIGLFVLKLVGWW